MSKKQMYNGVDINTDEVNKTEVVKSEEKGSKIKTAWKEHRKAIVGVGIAVVTGAAVAVYVIATKKAPSIPEELPTELDVADNVIDIMNHSEVVSE